MRFGAAMSRRAGFTLLELLVALSFGAFVLVLAFRLVSNVLTASTSHVAREAARTDLDDILTVIRQEFGARGPTASLLAVPTPAFLSLGAAPCSGLTITQPEPAGGIRSVTFQTECVGGGPASFPSGPRVHPDIRCPGGRSRIVITRSGGVRVYPAPGRALSAAACFRVNPGLGVTAEIGSVFSGTGSSHLLLPLFLSVNDRSTRIQIFPR